MAATKPGRPYKPTLLRLPFVIFIFVYICSLIALLEYTRRNLPILRDRPPTPGEVVPAGDIPLTTAAASYDDPQQRVPHPPTSQFEGIDVPAFRTGHWGLSVERVFTHGEPLTIDKTLTYLPSLEVELDDSVDPYKMGRCVMPVFKASFTNNPDDCNALVEGTFVSERLEYKVHLVHDDCYSSAVQLDNFFWQMVLMERGSGLTLAPDCWSSEELMLTTFTNTWNQYPGKTIIMTTGSDGFDSVAFVNTSTKRGWPLNINAGTDCWEIVSTPYVPLPRPDSLTVYEMGDLWPTTVSGLSMLSDWAEKRIIRAYMTEEPLHVGMYFNPAKPDHVGCWRDVAATTSGTSSIPTTNPAQTIPIFSTASMPPTSTNPANTSGRGTSLASQVASSVVNTPWASITAKFEVPSMKASSSPSLNSFWTSTSTTKTSPNERTSSGLEDQDSTKKNHAISSVENDTRTTDESDPARTTYTSSTTIEAVTSETSHFIEHQQSQNPVTSKTKEPTAKLRSAESVVSANAGISSDKMPGKHTETNLGAQQIAKLLTSTTMPLSSAFATARMAASSSPESPQLSHWSAESASVPNNRPSSKKARAGDTSATMRTDPSTVVVEPGSESLAQSLESQTIEELPVSFIPVIQPVSTKYTSGTNGIFIGVPPTPRPTPPSSSGSPEIVKPDIRRMTVAEYLTGLLGPVIFCTLLSVLIQVLCANLRAVMPFAILSSHRRSKSGGIGVSDSVCLVLGGIKGPWTSLRLLYRLREPLPFLLDLLVLLSTVLTSISTSTVSLGFFGFCETGSHDGWCYMGLGYYSLTLKIAEGMLIGMAVALLLVGFLLMKLKTGVVAAPWSVGHVASVSVSVNEPNVRGLWDVLRDIRTSTYDDNSITAKMMEEHLERYKFTLGEHRDHDAITKYGILAHEKRESTPHMPGEDKNDDILTYELEAIITHDPINTTGEDTDTASRYSCFTPSMVSYNTGRTSLRPFLQDGHTSSVRSSMDISSLHFPLDEDPPSGESKVAHTGLSNFKPAQDMEGGTTYNNSPSQSHPEPAAPEKPATTKSTFLTESHPSIRASVQTVQTYRGSYSPSMTSTTALIPPLDVSTAHSSSSSSTVQPSTSSSSPTKPTPTNTPPEKAPQPQRAKPDRPSLHTIFQITVLLLLSGLFILITYYESVEINPHQPDRHTVALSFEQFMDSQSIGVSILFTSLAVFITLFWDYLLSRMIITCWWTVLSDSSGRLSRKEMLTPPPITVFDGFGKSLRLLLTRLGGTGPKTGTAAEKMNLKFPLISILVCLAGILSKGIPILMAEIPFRRYQTWGLHLVTGWTTVVILGYMILVLAAFILVVNFVGTAGGKGQLPVMPDCIAGVVYYLACDDGELVRDFQRGQDHQVVEKENVADGRVRATGGGLDDVLTESHHGVGYVFGDGNCSSNNERRVGFKKVVL